MTTQTVSLRSEGFEAGIEKLLRQSLFSFENYKLKAWMRWIYDPAHCLVVLQDEQPVAMLQYRLGCFQAQNQHAELANIEIIAVHPDYSSSDLTARLLDAFCEVSTCNQLLASASYFLKSPLTRRRFEDVYDFQDVTIYSSRLKTGQDNLVNAWDNQEDLYSVYKDFIQHFNLVMYFDAPAFWSWIHYLKECKYRIRVHHNLEGRLDGFAIVKIKQFQADAAAVFYRSSSVLADLVKDLSMTNTQVILHLSPYERVESLFKDCSIQKGRSYCLRLNQPALYSRWQKQPVKSPADIFAGQFAWFPYPID